MYQIGDATHEWHFNKFNEQQCVCSNNDRIRIANFVWCFVLLLSKSLTHIEMENSRKRRNRGRELYTYSFYINILHSIWHDVNTLIERCLRIACIQMRKYAMWKTCIENKYKYFPSWFIFPCSVGCSNTDDTSLDFVFSATKHEVTQE